MEARDLEEIIWNIIHGQKNYCPAKGKKKLKTVSIGENVTKIGKNAFAGCGKLVNIVVKGNKLKRAGKNCLQGISTKAVIYVPSSKLKKYKALLQNKGQKKTVKIKK